MDLKMFREQSLKFKIVVSMVLLSLVTTIIASCAGIWKSSQIITNNAKSSFVQSANIVAEKIYAQFYQVEKNTKLLAQLSSNATSIQSQADMNKLRVSQDGEYSKVRSFSKTIAQNVDGAQATYFYFDQKYSPGYDGSWFAKEGDEFKRQTSNAIIEDDEDNAWYFLPIKLNKPVWSEAYTDPDTNVPMITYSLPVYKNGFFLGLAGIDIALDDLNKILADVKIYKDTHAFLVDEQFRVISSREFETGQNILEVKNGAYKFLEKETAKNANGSTTYKNGLFTQVLSYSKLPNGFILIIEVPQKNIPTKMAETVILLSILGALTVFITAVLALKLGDVLSGPINRVVFSLSNYARKLSTGSDTYLSLSQKLAEGSTKQAASVQETSSTLEESTSMISQNNQSTKQAVLLANDTKEFAIRGEREMSKVVESVAELKKSSEEISKITEVISRIAAQTNILALNAAVEAARAGDAGQGFNVVAEEVRKLAHRTAEATTQITNIIEKNISLSGTCEGLTKQANDSLAEINEQAQKVSELLSEISSSSNEQAVGIAQITTAVGEIEQVIQVNARHADTIAQISQELLHNIQTGIGEIEYIVNGNNNGDGEEEIKQLAMIED